MIRNLITCATGWAVDSAENYALCHNMYGGSFITHPDVLEFLHKRLDCFPAYYIKRDKHGALLGGFCTWKSTYLAGDSAITQEVGANHYSFNKDEITLPLHPALRTIVPFKTKLLSPINQHNVLNSSFRLNSGRGICIAKSCEKDGFSSKTKSRRNSELNKFLNAGGEIIEQSKISPENLTDIFCDLYEARWGHRPTNRVQLVDAIQHLRPLFFGHVLMGFVE